MYVELLLIRWVSTEASIFAYLQNSILIACFLGLGMGLLAPMPGDNPRRMLPPLLLLSALLNIPTLGQWVKELSKQLAGFHDFVVWNGDHAPTHPFLALCGVFVMMGACWATMVPLGAELGQLLHTAPRRMLAYSADIFGSLMGVWLFTLLGYLSLPPVAWFTGLAVLLLLNKNFRTPLSLAAIAIIVGLAAFGYSDKEHITTRWTPYQKLQFGPNGKPNGWLVLVNNQFFQEIIDNTAESQIPSAQRPVAHYNVPSRLAKPFKRALVVGAGTGNDVAGVVRNSEAEIVAVDIDPVLLQYGGILHPEKPYSNPRVIRKCNDARAVFLNEPPGSFDLIVMGLLDSHTTPNLSNARLDNFVYTRESIEAASRLLSPQGILVVHFAAQRPYIADRLANTMEAVFRKDPLVFQIPVSTQGWGGLTFVSGNLETVGRNLAQDPALADFVAKNVVARNDRQVAPISDSWPYLYLEKPNIPTLFWLLGLVLGILWVGSSWVRYKRFVAPRWNDPQEMFYVLLGMSFSLVQVFSVNKAAILFGSTWLVNSVAMSGILFMILCANGVVGRVRIPNLLLGIGLTLSCFFLAYLPLDKLLLLPWSQRLPMAALISGLPMLLSGLLFGQAFQSAKDPGRALGANLFGALVGGALQLITFQFGIPSLMVVAGISYGVAGFLYQPRALTDPRE